jgi:hypothetical protein
MKSLRDEILRGKMKSTIVEYKERETEQIKMQGNPLFLYCCALFCKYIFAYGGKRKLPLSQEFSEKLNGF